MSSIANSRQLTPFAALADYEQRSLTHVGGLPEQIEAPGLWRGIGFRVGSRRLVSGIDEVGEILNMPVLTIVPGTRDWLLGVANVRGNLVPVVDLKQYLTDETTVLSDFSRVLLVRQPGGSNVGLLIDELLGQRSFSEEQRALAIEEEDEHFQRFVVENYPVGEERWGMFSMPALVRSHDFIQASL